MFAARSFYQRTFTVAVASSITLCSLSPESYAAPVKDDLQNRRVVVVGGGTGGLGVAAQLHNAGVKNVTIIEPKSVHYYQPLWTLVGGGIKDKKESVKDMKDVVPKGVQWIQQSVNTFQPDNNQITLQDGSKVEYDYLIVAAGLQINWNKISGLVEGLEKPDSGVVSIYDFKYCDKTFQAFEKMKNDPLSKKMIFTVPVGLIKCAGAPQKIMWILEDTLRSEGLRDSKTIEFQVPGGAMFGIKRYADQLDVIRKARDVNALYKRELVAIDVNNKIASFKDLDSNTILEEKYDYLHVTPPMSAPDFIKQSPLADSSSGWMEVNKNTLQSTKYSNVFGIGDCTNTPNSKTAAAITAQAPVVVHNLLEVMENKPLTGNYNGYASCPLIISRNHVLLAEFGYDGKILETFDGEYGKFPYNVFVGKLLPVEIQQRFFYWLKEQFFPFAYWQLWVRGQWYGTNGPFKPDVTKVEK